MKVSYINIAKIGFRQFFICTGLAAASLILSGQEQKSFLQATSEKFLQYCSEVPWEDIYIHTDRSDYISGEEIWFSAYAVDRLTGSLSRRSSIAYFEVVNSSNHPVVRKRIRLINGSGPGEVSLPDTLRTGVYAIRAYTGRMKDFLPVNCFIRKIRIYNVLGEPFSINDSASVSLQRDDYPGKAKDRYTQPGFDVSVNNKKPEAAEFSINADRSFLERSNRLCYYFVHTHGIINQTGFVALSGGTTILQIPRKVLIPGINHITFFDSAGKPVAERYIYTYNSGENKALELSSEQVKTRDLVTVRFDEENLQTVNENKPVYSISVVPSEGKSNFPGIRDYLILGSEFGILPDEIIMAGGGNFSSEVFEELLSGKSSYWIDWNAILSGKYQSDMNNGMKYDNALEGRLLSRETNLPAVNEYVIMSVPDKNASFQYSRSDRNGRFSFSVPVSDHPLDLIIQPENPEKNFSVEMLSPFEENIPLIWTKSAASPGIPPGFISKWGVNYQVRRIYGITSTGEPLKEKKISSVTKRFYGKPDIEIRLDDYIKLPVMEEVFYELIPGVSLRKRRTGYELSIIDPPEFRTFGRPPVMMVDGVIINDASIIGNMDPETVEKVDVVKERYFVGDYLFYGIINVITRAGDFSGVNLPDYAVRLRYSATDPVFTFKLPGYSSAGALTSRIPDFRNTLFWNPSLAEGTDGKYSCEFRASDYTGQYTINIQGFNAEGKPVSLTGSFTINK